MYKLQDALLIQLETTACSHIFFVDGLDPDLGVKSKLEKNSMELKLEYPTTATDRDRGNMHELHDND